MKKVLVLIVCVLFLLSGCTIGEKEAADILVTGMPTSMPQGEEEKSLLPFEKQKEFVFSSGVGGWRTVLMLSPDGTFEGDYADGELGDMGEDYPNGSTYLCPFTGNFRDIEKVDDFTYSMELDTLSYEEEKEEWIEDGVRYVPSYPYGLEDGETFYLYLPGKEVKDIPEGFLWWWLEYLHAPDNRKPETLDCYAIYNVEQQCGFTE